MPNVYDVLNALGWTPELEASLTPKERLKSVGRVVEARRRSFLVHDGDAVITAVARGALYRQPNKHKHLPVVGDWVVIDVNDQHNARILRVLPRQSVLIRQAPGTKTAPQVLASNLDEIFIVTSLNQDFNVARIERYLALVHTSGARPVIVLTKADLVDEVESFLVQIDGIAPGVETICVSVVSGEGMDVFTDAVVAGRTVALIGSSGVGKSTLVNALYGQEIQTTKAIRELDGRGRHTTTSRQLRVLPSGGLVIDTPGMRELQLWGAEDGIKESFEDVVRWASDCKFRNCSHVHEAQCAVKGAVVEGLLAADRLERWRKLSEEARIARTPTYK